MPNLLDIPGAEIPIVDVIASFPDQPLQDGVGHIASLSDAVREAAYEAAMMQSRVNQALMHRRWAIHKLRIGDRASHRDLMLAALFFLKLARKWRSKK